MTDRKGRVRSPEAKAARAAAEKRRRATVPTRATGGPRKTANTDDQPSKPWLIKPGEALNPAGRPKGSRNKLGEAFITALQDDFNEHGVAAIVAMREADPSAYVRVIASLLPKEIKVETVSDLTDEQLDDRIRQLNAALQDEAAETPAGARPENTKGPVVPVPKVRIH